MAQPQETESTTVSNPHHPVLGTAGLVLGVLVILLALIDRAGGLPFSMPRSWYSGRPIWYMLAVGLLVGGGYLLRPTRRHSENWRSGRAGRRFQSVVLYTREGCHLCDQAHDVLLKYRRYLPEIAEVDISTDPVLADQFRTCIPVVEIDGKVRFRGDVNEILLRRLIEGARPR